MDYKLLFSTFTIFYTTFDDIHWSNPTLAGWISNGCLLLFILVNRGIYKFFFSRQYLFVNLCALILGIIITYSGFSNADLTFDRLSWDGIILESMKAVRPDHAFYNALKIVSFILFFQYLNVEKKDRKFLDYFFNMFLIYTIVSDVNALMYSSPDGEGYLVGNKFTVSYCNLLLGTLYYMRHPLLLLNKPASKKLKIILLLSLLIAIKTECTTAVLGTIVMFLFMFKFNGNWKIKLYRWQTYLLLLIVCDILFFFFVSAFIHNPVIEFIIVDLLGEDMTLTGRIGIYAALSDSIMNCPLWGYGLGNAHLFTTMNGIGVNAQNGFFNLMLEIGFLGCAAYFFMVFKMLKISSRNIYVYPIICLMYTMLILSSIEITFSTMMIVISMFLLLNNRPQAYVKHRQYIK